MKWFIRALQNYVNFKGRARRKEYWMFVLFYIILWIFAEMLDYLLSTNFKMQTEDGPQGLPGGYINSLLSLALFLPSLSVSVRRLHDTGKSGWYILLSIVPTVLLLAGSSQGYMSVWYYFGLLTFLIGGLWILVLMCIEGDKGANQYGSDPKDEGNTSVTDSSILDSELRF